MAQTGKSHSDISIISYLSRLLSIRRREIEGPRRACGAKIVATVTFTGWNLLQYIQCVHNNATGAEMQNAYAQKLHPILISGSSSVSREPLFKPGPGIDGAL